MNEIKPKPDMRGVRVNQTSSPWIYSRRLGDLCERCGEIDRCPIASHVLKPQKPTSECDIFAPVLVFQSVKGIEGEFNTIRVGPAWSKRLHRGKVVSLWSKTARIGTAEVKEVIVGDKVELLRAHGPRNHLVIADDISHAKAAEIMPRIMRNAYGNMIWSNHDIVTVIYLERIE